jgi:hypothetical protein
MKGAVARPEELAAAEPEGCAVGQKQGVDEAVLDVVVGRVPRRGPRPVVGEGAVAVHRGEASAELPVEDVAPVEALGAGEAPQTGGVAVDRVETQVEGGAEERSSGTGKP